MHFRGSPASPAALRAWTARRRMLNFHTEIGGAVRHRVEQVRMRVRATELGAGMLPSLPGTGDVTWSARLTCFLSANVAGLSA